jgi:EAL domain-containing protein (putative c-di-GMP-specific phosphodiesterase class I)
VASVIALAEALGVVTVGEGVESEGQRDALRARGCTFAQGYLFAKPGPLEEIHRWLGDDSSGSALGSSST